MQRSDWDAVAKLIYDGTNHWYVSRGLDSIFNAGWESTRLFCQVYEALDPGCCILAVDSDGRVAGSCFYHPRDTHVSLGIMNVDKDRFSRGLAKQLLSYVVNVAKQQEKPLRLVSSALNLDSYSLYNRAGLTPRQVFQDMCCKVPLNGLPETFETAKNSLIRKATRDDVEKMVQLEYRISGIKRQIDYEYFVRNELGCWRTMVLEEDGELVGFLASIQHSASNMLGPGVMQTQQQAIQLVHAQLNLHRGRTPVFLVPVECQELVQVMYRLGARNCEIHFAQALGDYRQPSGVVMPTFMPETG